MTRPVLSLLTALFLAFSTNTLAQSGGPSLGPSPDPTLDPVVDTENPPGMIEVQFTSHGARLNALHYLANGAGPHPTVLLLHGYPGNEKNLDLAQYFRRAGWNVFFFHYRGAWGSEGQFSFMNAVEDVAVALAHLRASGPEYRIDKNHIALVGHSMGGFMALAGAANDSLLKCTTGIAAADFTSVSGWLADNPEAGAGRRQDADGLVMLAGHDGSNVIEQMTKVGAAYPLLHIADGLEGKAVLLVGARQDAAVPITVHENTVSVFSGRERIALSSEILDTDHAFSGYRLRLSRIIADWLDANCR